jgi:hypothetical protein
LQSDEQRVTIYVKLLKEGTDVIRPTEAVRLSDEYFRLLATPGYDLENEKWEFPRPRLSPLNGRVGHPVKPLWPSNQLTVQSELSLYSWCLSECGATGRHPHYAL